MGQNFKDVVATIYGQVQAAKIAFFLVMLVLAAMNRYRHTPALAGHALGAPSLAKLRRSIRLETVAAVGLLGLVFRLGTLQQVLVT